VTAHGYGGIAPRILKLRYWMGVSDRLQALAAVNRWKESWVPVGYNVG